MRAMLDRGCLLLVGALALAALAACTPRTEVTVQAPSPAQAAGIAVTGTGSVSARPDVAQISLGVSVTAPAVAKARADAAAAMVRVQEALKAKGVAEKDVQTQSLSITPQYDFQNRAEPRITGYQVSNQVRITIRNIDSASEVLDAAVAAGRDAVRVNGIAFAVDQPEALLTQAREEAVKNARARAEVLAKAAGVSLGKARSIAESSGGGPVPLALPARAQSAEASTPVNPGEQRLSVSVSIVYEIGP